MADTACVLCGEDWDTSHIRHDEPLYVQKLFFAGKGCPTCTGKRQRPKSVAKILHTGHAIMQEEGEVIDRLHMLGDGRDELDYRTEWDAAKKPTVLKTCEGCGEAASFDADDLYGYRDEEKTVEGIYIWTRPLYGIGERELVKLTDLVEGTVVHGRLHDLTHFDDNWDFSEVAGKTVCRECFNTCDGETAPEHEWQTVEGTRQFVLVKEAESCGALIFCGEAHSRFVSDTYDAGSSFYSQELNKTFCSDCIERLPRCGNCGSTWDFGDPDAVFIEDDEYRCRHCTSFKQCDRCDEWVESVNDEDYCPECVVVARAEEAEAADED